MPLFRCLTQLGVLLAALLVGGCDSSMRSANPAKGKRDINAVLADHDKRLMALPGVVGVYVGLLDDEKTPCLKVMLRQRDPKLEQALPRVLEGYRVVAEVTGEIKPMAPR
jgi:hypothetical protein